MERLRCVELGPGERLGCKGSIVECHSRLKSCSSNTCVIRTLYASLCLIFAKKPYIHTYFVCKKNGTLRFPDGAPKEKKEKWDSETLIVEGLTATTRRSRGERLPLVGTRQEETSRGRRGRKQGAGSDCVPGAGLTLGKYDLASCL